MMKAIRKVVSTAAVGLACLAITACASTVEYKPEYVSAGLAAPIVDGKAVIVMDKTEQEQSITSNPTSFTGGGTTLTAPVGEIIRETGLKVFGAGFSDGAEVSETAKPGAYDVALTLNGFSYKYDQLSSLGFEVRPKVTVGLEVDAVAPDGQRLFTRKYERNDYLVAGYVFSGNPGERINQALHMAVAEIFREILDDVAEAKAQAS